MTKNAFLILAHADPLHLERLIEALGPGCDIYVHLDRDADLGAFAHITAAKFIADRRSVSWAGISMVDAILSLMTAAMASAEDYGHVGILTGADYPLRNGARIAGFLADHPDREFIKFSDIRETRRYHDLITRRYYREPFVRSRNKWVRLADRALRKALSSLRLPNRWDDRVIPYRGHTWCIITGACCRHVLDFHNANPWFYAMNAHSFAPDEHYFHTIIGNSPFAGKSLGFQACQAGLWPMATTHLIDPSLTKWFTLADWDMIAPAPRLFVRKVRSTDGASLVDRIDTELHERPVVLGE